MFGRKVQFSIAIIFGANLIFGLPVDKNADEETTTEISSDNNSTNGTHKELPIRLSSIGGLTLTFDIGNSTIEVSTTKKEVYIIKAVTYEIGVLADVPDNDTTTDDGPVTRQQVDLTFYDTKSNDTAINFGDVPLPVQTTGVNGQVITGIAPVHIGAVSDVGDVLKALPFTGTIVNITEKDSSYFHLNRENLTDTEQQVILSSNDDLAKLPILNNVLLPDTFDEAYDSVTTEKSQQ